MQFMLRPSFIVRPMRTFSAIRTVQVPYMADSISQGTLATWEKSNIILMLVEVGEWVKQDDVLATIETEKVTIPVNCPASGILVECFAKEGDTVAVGADFCKIKEQAEGGQKSPIESKAAEVKTAEVKAAEVKNEPKNELKNELKNEPKAVKNEPKNIKNEINSINSSASSEARSEFMEPMSRMRSRIATRLKESQQTNASLTTFNEVDMSSLISMRSTFKDAFAKKHSCKLGFMSAFVKASATALCDIPQINARIQDDQIVHPNYVDISVAVATPKGLVTPVLRDCQKMTMAQIELAIAGLSEKARSSSLSIEDMQGGTFTISNGGVFGSLMGTPIINVPQSAILGMHAVKDRAVVVDGKVEVRPMMYLALTYDHRLIDGREAVSFLVRIKELLEDPRRLLLDL